MKTICPQCKRILAYDLIQYPKERHFWFWNKKQWVTVKHKKRKLKCAFCGYKFQDNEIRQLPTVSLEEEEQKLKDKVIAHKNIQRKKLKHHA
jgi:hypothetical protein